MKMKLSICLSDGTKTVAAPKSVARITPADVDSPNLWIKIRKRIPNCHQAYLRTKYNPMPNTSVSQNEKYATAPQTNRKNLLPKIRDPILFAIKQTIAMTSIPTAIFF